MRLRLGLLVSILFAASLAGAQDRKVSFSSSAQRAERLVPELAKRTERKLLSSPSVANDVLVVSVADVSVDELLSKIASVLDAEWQKEGDSLRLVRTRESEKAEEAAEIAAREKQIRAAVDALAQRTIATPFDKAAADKLLKDLRVLDPKPGEDEYPDHSMAEMRIAWGMFDRSPANRAIVRLLQLADLKAIAAASGNQRVVFSTAPNRFQRSLGAGANAVIDKLREEQAVWRDVLKTWERPENASYMGGDPRYGRTTDAPIAKLVLSVSVYNPISELAVSMVALDSQGKPVLLAESRLQADWLSEFLAANELISGVGKPDFQLSERSLAHLRLQSIPSSEFKKPDMTPEWMAVFTHPEEADPLSFGASECLMEMAKRSACNLVAAPTDALGWLTQTAAHEGRIDLPALAKAARGRYGIDTTVEGGWMTVKPLRPVQARRERVDRKSLAEFAQATAASGIPSLDAMARLAVKNDAAAMWPFMFGYCSAIVPRSERLVQFADWSTLRLYGNLTPAQRSALDHGESYAAAILSTAARECLLDLLFNDLNGMPSSRLTRVGSERYDGQMSEFPSELLAGLKPGEIRLTWKWTEEPAVVAATKGDEKYTPWTHVAGAEELGGLLARHKGVDENEYWFGSTRALSIRIFPTPELYRLGNLVDHRFNMRAASVTYGDLPAGFRAAVEKFKAQSLSETPPSRQPPPRR